jgi:hypothetical protein
VGVIAAALIIIIPIVWLVMRCRTSIRIAVAAATWLALYIFLGKIGMQQSGQPHHGLFIGISGLPSVRVRNESSFKCRIWIRSLFESKRFVLFSKEFLDSWKRMEPQRLRSCYGNNDVARINGYIRSRFHTPTHWLSH